jgi:hypothetical protein
MELFIFVVVALCIFAVVLLRRANNHACEHEVALTVAPASALPIAPPAAPPTAPLAAPLAAPPTATADDPHLVRLEALARQTEAATDPKAWTAALVALGEAYHRGAYPHFRPHPPSALRCLRLAAMSPCADLAGQAQLAFLDARLRPLALEDIQGLPTPPSYGERACAAAAGKLARLPASAFAVKPRGPPPPPAAVPTTAAPIATTTSASRRQPRQLALPTARRQLPGRATVDHGVVVVRAEAPRAPPPVVRSAKDAGSQNVHDHAVVGALRANADAVVKDLVLDEDGRQLEAAARAVGEAADRHLAPEAAARARRVLGALGDLRLSSLGGGASEREVLAGAWARIQREADGAVRERLAGALVEQLATGVEGDHVVCATGRAARILGAFDGQELPDLQTARPVWAVREELGTLAARVRAEALAGADAAQREAYERGENAALELAMRNGFRAAAKETYVDGLHMAEGVVGAMVDELAEGF